MTTAQLHKRLLVEYTYEFYVEIQIYDLHDEGDVPGYVSGCKAVLKIVYSVLLHLHALSKAIHYPTFDTTQYLFHLVSIHLYP